MKALPALKARILANPEARAEYEAQAPEFELARELITARTRAGLTQSELAERMHTTQSTIARLVSSLPRRAPSVTACACVSWRLNTTHNAPSQKASRPTCCVGWRTYVIPTGTARARPQTKRPDRKSVV